jgi:hypothetical protein
MAAGLRRPRRATRRTTDRGNISATKITRASAFGGDGPSGGRHGCNAGGVRRATRRTTDCGKHLRGPARKRFALPAAESAVRCSQGYHMKDPWNPTPDEIRRWAADPEALCPEDWDLVIVGIGHDELLLNLAADESCPKNYFFLRCLCLLVGDFVRTKGNTADPNHIEQLLRRAEEIGEPFVALWVTRSRELLAHPERFEYNQWCRGGLAAKGPAERG